MSRRRLFGYALAGGSAAVIDLGLFVVLVAQGTGIAVAALSSFGLAAAWNYAVSARFVFREPPTGRAFTLFLAMALMGAAVNAAITWVAVAHGVVPAIGKMLGIGTAFFLNYAANSRIVFRPGLPEDRRP